MRDEIDSKEGPRPPGEEKRKPAELSDQDLEMVSGGRGIVKLVDAATPKLHEACVTEHSK
jgi:hypothetical protein